jgi:hypothetical protein
MRRNPAVVTPWTMIPFARSLVGLTAVFITTTAGSTAWSSLATLMHNLLNTQVVLLAIVITYG